MREAPDAAQANARTAGREQSVVATQVKRKNKRFRLPLALLGLGLVITAVLFWFVRQRDQERAQLEFEQRARDVAFGFESSLQAPLEAVHSLVAFVDAHGSPDRASFEEFARPARARHRGIAALEWAPRVLAESRPGFEETSGIAIIEPGEDGMMPALERDLYYPLERMDPFDGEVIGLDVAFEAGRRAVVDRAIEARGVVVSERFQLVEDGPGEHSVAVYGPVFERDQPELVKGLAIGLVRIRPIVNDGLEGANLDGMRVVLLDRSSEGEAQLLHETAAGAHAELDSADLSWRRPIPYGDRDWEIAFIGEPSHFSSHAAALGVLAVCLLVTAAVVGGLTTGSLVKRLRAEVSAAKQLGQYTLIRKLGEGGMGSVYRADHALLRRPTAIKLVKSSKVGHEALLRFEREVRVTSQLTHPNTIAVYDFGLTPNGVFYYAMELLDGLDGEELVERTGPLPPGRTVHLLKQACGSLAEAHGIGLVHRDVKPANMMICERGGIFDFVKVLDFGLVKKPEGDTDLSTEGDMLGTPLFMPPESMTAPDEVGPAADVYALGAVAYFMVTGRYVFDGKTIIEICTKHMTAPPVPPSEFVNCPPGLEALILRCLEKEPGKRPADAGELGRLLRELADIEPWTENMAAAWWNKVGRQLAKKQHAAEDGAPTGQTVAVDLAGRVAPRGR